MAETKILVVAVDFGSSGAGYAFSFAYQYKNNPLDICTSLWNNGNGPVQAKVPAVLLFDPDKKFHSFGFEAEDKYEELMNANKAGQWYFLKGFKMQLYSAVNAGEDIRIDFELLDVGGKSISAKAVFSAAIGFLKDHFIQQMHWRKLGTVEDDIFWVVSVPAIWNDSAKQFMRESAEKVGIQGEKFSMVYEPEAASIYARLLPVDKLVGNNGAVLLEAFDPGRKFIVVDAGGGTVDISAQQVLENGEVKIIHKECGGPWGGECINQQFVKMLKELFGNEVMKQFKRNNGEDLLQLLRDFEVKKRNYRVEGKESVTIRMPFSLTELFLDIEGSDVATKIAISRFNATVRLKRDKLSIAGSLVETFFSETIKMIIDEVVSILKHERCSDVSAIMMAGGFSEADTLQHAIKRQFQSLEVFIPLDGSLAVLKGAVIYGHNPSIVSSRVCNYTYGIACSKIFDPSTHDPDKKWFLDGRELCKHLFEVLFEIDEEVHIGQTRKTEFTDTFLSDHMQIRRYEPLKCQFMVSTKKDPFYTTDESCMKHGSMILSPPNGMWPQITKGHVLLKIAGTELVGTYENEDSQEQTSVRFEFLPSTSKSPERKRLFDPFYLDI
ncbi:heat shock 70 kDa protein 12A-like [Mytilus trossulus]|uniref:heat shock 70 kDa protein 12A-like n=1 Tax=Mytilus trossulus TaxID=6551 RepID=UPI003006EF63